MNRPDEIAALADELENFEEVVLRTDDGPEWSDKRSLSDDEREMVVTALRLSATSPGDAVRMREAFRQIIVEMRDKHSSPTGDSYSCGVWDQSQRIPTPPSADVALLRHLSGCARAFLQHFNPCDLAEDKAQQWQALEHQCDLADAAIQSAAATPPSADVEIGAVSGDGSPETIKFDGRWFDRRETVDALTSLLAEARAANWHGADGVLEVIAKRLEAWDTTDIWRSDAAGLVRSYKQSAAHGGGTKSDGGVERRHTVYDGEATRLTRDAKAVREAGVAPGPSDPAQEPEVVAYLSFDLPIWQQREHRIRRLMTDLGMPNSLSLSEAMKQLIRDVEYIDKNTRPVSLDRLTESNISDEICHVFGCRSTCVSECNSEINKDKCGEAARRVLALIEGRT